MTTPSVRIETVTTKKAERWLRLNVSNRPIKEWWVQQLVHRYESGEWTLTPDAIAFDSDGMLRNGQHRLRMVLAIGETVPFIVVRNISPQAFLVMDQGRSRTLQDALSVKEEEHTRLLAGAAQWMKRLDSPTPAQYRYSHPEAPSVQTLVDDIDAEWPDLRVAVATIAGLDTRAVGFGTVWAALLCRFRRIEPEAADRFVTDVIEGTNLERGDVRLTLRNRILAIRAESKTMLRTPHLIALIIKTWNHGRTGTAPRRLVWNPDREDFPTITAS